jgi:hypothetical protein
MKYSNYKYDITFAFLDKDEPFANQINELLRDKFKTFLFSKKQEYKADLEREMLLLDVFKKQSRCVVLFYRKNWGTSPWTAIEEKAVRTRISEGGIDNLIVITLDSISTVPKYISKAKIWTQLAKAGINGTAAFIEEQVKLLGGGIDEDTSLNVEAVSKEEPQFEIDSSKFLQAVSGLEIAAVELKKLFNALETERNKIIAADNSIPLTYKKDDTSCIVNCGDYSIRFYLQTEKSDILMDSPLYFELKKHGSSSSGLDILTADDYHFELKKIGVYGWIKGADSQSFISSKQLAEDSIKLLLSHFQNLEDS